MEDKKKKTFRLAKQGDKLVIEALIDQEGKSFPLLGPFSTEEELKDGICVICEELQTLLEEAKALFEKDAVPINLLDLQDMDAEQIWNILNEIKDEQQFVDAFNALHEEKRKEVANFVFTQCNVFAGRASIFSLRYNNDSALLE